MIKRDWKSEWPLWLLLVANFAAYAFCYGRLPDPLPIHWNLHGEVDGSMSKSIFSALLFPSIALAAYLLPLGLPGIDPKGENYPRFARAYGVIRLVLVLFLSLICWVVLLYSLGMPISVATTVHLAAAAVLVLIGNQMGKIRQNWFVGFRFPWTLSSEETWNRTHRLGGRLLVAAGLIALLAVFLKPPLNQVLFLGPILLAVTLTGIYSWAIYRRR